MPRPITFEIPDPYDLRDVDYVEIVISPNKKHIWINVDGECKLRIYNIRRLTCLK